jgi:hypothetical protein
VEGDNNTNFFHNYVNFHKNCNSIWEISSNDGGWARSFEEKVEPC